MKKHIITTILVITSLFCFAQQNGASLMDRETLGKGTLKSGGITFIQHDPIYDTVSISILYSDSLNVLKVTKGYDVKVFDGGYYYEPIRSDQRFAVTYYNANAKLIYRHKEYLDENKKPLSKSCIVWQAQ